MRYLRWDHENGLGFNLRELALLPLAGVRIWLAGPLRGAIADDHWHMLSCPEKEHASRFMREQDRALFAQTRVALRHILATETGVLPHEILFAEGPFGKPFLAGGLGPHFNVSHSGSYALIAVSAKRPVGIDIELMRHQGDELSLAQAFFSPTEYETLAGLDGPALLGAFYRIWTCKEAVLKACGRGITEHLKDFTVLLTSEGCTIRPEPSCPLEIASATLFPLDVPSGYAGCYALA